MPKPTNDWIAEAVKDAPAICTTPETCAIIRTTRRNLYRLVARGRIHAVRPADAGSSRLLVPRASIEAYLRSLEAERAAA